MGSRSELVQEVIARGVVPTDRADDARAAAADESVDLEQWLRDAGCDPNEVMLAACEVFALPPAPVAWLTTAQLKPDDAWNVALFRELGAVPVHPGPPLRIAFASALVATSEKALQLPTHRAYLASPEAILTAQTRVLAATPQIEVNEVKPSNGAAHHATDWAAAVDSPPPPSTEAAATTKVPRVLQQTMVEVGFAIAEAQESQAPAPAQAQAPLDEEAAQRTERHMAVMPPPMAPPVSASRPESTVVRLIKPLLDKDDADAVRPRMQGKTLPTPLVLSPQEIEAQLAEAAGLGGKTFGVRAIVRRATTAEEAAAQAALEAREVTALDLMRAIGVFPAALAAKLMSDVAAALAQLHEQGFVHRELKPSSVLLSPTGTVTLAEAGRAQLEHKDECLTDVFSLGRLCFHLLSGHDPFGSDDGPAPDLMEVAPTLPELLPDVIDRMMKRERSERVPSAQAVHALLAPLVALIDARHPTLVADAVRDAGGLVKKLRVEQAHAEYLRASACMKLRPARKKEAAYGLRRSIELDSAELRGQNLLRKLCASEKFTFVIPDDPELVKAKASDDPALLRAAGEKCVAAGAIEQAALCFRRARDEASLAQLREIVGDDPCQPFPFLAQVPHEKNESGAKTAKRSPTASTSPVSSAGTEALRQDPPTAASWWTSTPVLIGLALGLAVLAFLAGRFLFP